jgi:hypothetical protein
MFRPRISSCDAVKSVYSCTRSSCSCQLLDGRPSRLPSRSEAHVCWASVRGVAAAVDPHAWQDGCCPCGSFGAMGVRFANVVSFA